MPYDEKRVLQQLADPATRRKAFAEVVQHFGQPLYWKIRHIVLTHEDADDVLQNTFLKAWAKLDEFQCSAGGRRRRRCSPTTTAILWPTA